MGLATLLTPRLRGERMTVAHLAAICSLHQDERFMAHMGGRRSDADVSAYLERNIAHWDTYGFGMSVLHDPQTGEAVGIGGLRHLDVDGIDEVEIGYGIKPPLWGRGLGWEIATACLEAARERLSLPSLVAGAHPLNGASIHVMRKAGFVFERKVDLGHGPSVLYRATLR